MYTRLFIHGTPSLEYTFPKRVEMKVIRRRVLDQSYKSVRGFFPVREFLEQYTRESGGGSEEGRGTRKKRGPR